MVREPDATMQPTPQDNQLMSKHRILSLKSQLRIEWRDQDGQTETEQPDHSTSSGDSVTSSTRMRFSAHTGHGAINANGPKEISHVGRLASACPRNIGFMTYRRTNGVVPSLISVTIRLLRDRFRRSSNSIFRNLQG